MTDVHVTGGWAGSKSSVVVTAALSRGENRLSVVLQADGVQLWWPAGYGEQTMCLPRSICSYIYIINSMTACQIQTGF